MTSKESETVAWIGRRRLGNSRPRPDDVRLRKEEKKVICKKCKGEMVVFQPELFDDRGHYVCGCGYRSGRIFSLRSSIPNLGARITPGSETRKGNVDEKQSAG